MWALCRNRPFRAITRPARLFWSLNRKRRQRRGFAYEASAHRDFVPLNALEDALANAASDESKRVAFLQQLRESSVHIVLTNPEETDVLVLPQPEAVGGESKEPVLPLFTSPDRVRETDQIDETAVIIEKKCRQVVDSWVKLRESHWSPSDVSLIVNPFSACGFWLTATEVQRFTRGEYSSVGTGGTDHVRTEVIEKGTEVVIGNPPNVPELESVLREMLPSGAPEVGAVWVVSMQLNGGDPETLVLLGKTVSGLETLEDSTISKVAEWVREKAPDFESRHGGLIVADASHFVKFGVLQRAPFYQQ
uniref:SseB protein N-terminal domain-containing protein n=1 Tax=Chromera velia CCMP2878 TaxID=1169474 RepID=A0A0G4G794_9ALVE|mmetsp:Transcript_48276/g.95300  ORF Transcript_48276/g.95300 Transcript_48276/m.95300 type:complete len:306 (+) Transcript_48276:119-1036(+)|eukprot:Cvel_4273.t1-p1 / transcript=Cvel_4273.t1 / gene=Cvel_4273 / organism=Chromera_velia_CCMP2878 / gene_product=hypothetical protein / transcript_product=hypothetical protein / location=Cvel_scaffold185:36685-37599(+) / protein_length=305 / sequence_SO=supercontig / SO=protein_coding / is_pseudo=false